MALDPTLFSELSFDFKQWYHGQRVAFTGLKGHPFMDSLRRNPNAVGEVDPVILQTAPGGIRGNTGYSTAIARGAPPVGKKLLVEYGTHFAVAAWEDKVAKASKGNAGVYMDAVKKIVDGSLMGAGQTLAAEVCGAGGGALATVGTITASTNTIVLSDKDNIHRFWPGMPLIFSADDGSGAANSLRDSGAVVTVSTVSQATGTIVYTGTDVSGLAASDKIFHAESFAGNVSQSVIMKGLQAWIPYTAPTDTFFGVARSGLGAYVYGYSTSGDTTIENGGIQDRITKLAVAMDTRMGANPTECWLHPSQWNALQTSLQQSGIRILDVKNYTGTWNYTALEMPTSTGTVKVRADRNMPTNRAYLLDPDSIELRSMGEILQPMNEGGVEIDRDPNSLGWSTTFVTYGQFVCEAPGNQGVTALNAL
jgi:hypothetical protein